MGFAPFQRKRYWAAAILSAGLAVVGGCSSPQHNAYEEDAMRAQGNHVTDMQITEAVRDSGVRAAIISQHTLYPYHFVEGAAVLNDLGQRDIEVLSSHLRPYGGDLNVSRDSASAALYDARVRSVADALKAAGVGMDQVHIADGMAGGGMTSSEDVLRDVKMMRARQEQVQQDQSSGMGQQSINSGGSMGSGTGGSYGGQQ